MYQVINQLIYGHVQLINDSIKNQHGKLKRAYVKHRYNKVNPYTKSKIDSFDAFFELCENSVKKNENKIG